jgi:hypothetical protein
MADQETVLAQIPAEDPPTEQLDAVHDEPWPLGEPYVAVWPHTLDQVEKFPDAIAQVLPNGVLLVLRPDSRIPIKGYAPGAWLTFEHVGELYHARPVEAPRHRTLVEHRETRSDAPFSEADDEQDAMLSARSEEDYFQDGDRQEWASGAGPADPPQFLRSAVVEPRPKGAGAGRPPLTAVPDHPGSDEDRPPGRWRAFWQSLKTPPAT